MVSTVSNIKNITQIKVIPGPINRRILISCRGEGRKSLTFSQIIKHRAKLRAKWVRLRAKLSKDSQKCRTK